MTMTIATVLGRTVKVIEHPDGVSASVCCPITMRPEWTVYGATKAEALEAVMLELSRHVQG